MSTVLTYMLALIVALPLGFAAAYAPLMLLETPGFSLTLWWVVLLLFLPGPLLVGAASYGMLTRWLLGRGDPTPSYLARTAPLSLLLVALVARSIAVPKGFGLVAPVVISAIAVLVGGLLGDGIATRYARRGAARHST
jgi:hypothetical protein